MVTFFLKTSHGQMFTLQFISNVLLFRTVGGEGEAKSKTRHFVGMKDKVLLQFGGGRETPCTPCSDGPAFGMSILQIVDMQGNKWGDRPFSIAFDH